LFEIIKSDLAGRIGVLHTNHGLIETPAYVPVVHPVKQTIPTKKIREMGFELVITNAYITKNHYGQDAVDKGIHNVIGFDGAVMTDSGGYQVLEYGDVDVSASDMASFERGIKTDIAIPLDKPTGYGLPKNKAKSLVEHTLKVSKETLKNRLENGQIWVGPIQGGEHFELVKKSTQALVKYGYQMLALGSPVEFMESYEFKLLAEMILVAKKQMPYSLPLHLFGAGHPITIPMAVALGCDTFDSASYILYAKNGRYITEDGTRNIKDITYFSCNCEVCSKFAPKEITSLASNEKSDKIALHNLYSIKAEVDRVKEAILEGRLWEYAIKKTRAHPKLYETLDLFTDNSDYFIKTTPRFKQRALFLFSKEDQFRPEIVSFHEMVQRFKTKKKIAVISNDTFLKPSYLSPDYSNLKKKFSDSGSIQFCNYNPFLGIIPIEISDIYPASHYVMSKTKLNPEEFIVFAKTWNAFFKNNNFEVVYSKKEDEFIRFFIKSLKHVKKRYL